MSKILTPKRWSRPASIAFSVLLIIIFCLTLLPSPIPFGGAGVADASTTIGNFTYKKQLIFNTSATGANVTGSDQANFPICVHINSSSWGNATENANFFGAANVSGKRIQFFDSDQTTNLDYEVERYNATGNTSTNEAIYWVEAPLVAGNSTTDSIWVAYGNDPNGSNQDNPTGVWDSNYVAVYHMDDLTTSTLKDSTTNGFTGTKVGANTPIQAAGMVGYGQSFDPDTGYVTIPATVGNALTGSSYSTEETYGKITGGNVSSERYAVAIRNSGGSARHHVVAAATTGKLRVYARSNIETTARSYTSNFVFADGSYHYVATGVDLLNANLYAYMDGTGTSGAVTAFDNTTYQTTTGTGFLSFGTASLRMGGVLDEVRISKVLRSADWIKLGYYSMLKTNFNGDNGVSAPFLSWGAAIENPADISNTPSSHDFGIVQPSQTYWSNGVEPGWPLSTSDCWGNLTNNSSFAVDILASMTDMTGGTTWSIGSSPGTNVFTLKIGIAGLAGVGNFTTLSNTPVAWITNMAVGNMTRWTMVFYTPTNDPFDDGVPKSGNITLSAEAS